MADETPKGTPPLFLPEGSIRALIALAFIGPVAARFALGVPVPSEAVELAAAAAGGYGIMRVMQTKDGA